MVGVVFALFRDDSAKIMQAATEKMSAVAQDLVDEALQDDLARVDSEHVLPTHFCILLLCPGCVYSGAPSSPQAHLFGRVPARLQRSLSHRCLFQLPSCASVCGLWRCSVCRVGRKLRGPFEFLNSEVSI